MLNILIPCAGAATRFAATGRFTFPKLLIEVQGKAMINMVTDNLALTANYIFVVQKEHYEKYALQYLLPLIVKPNDCRIIQVDGLTEGAACTALLAKGLIDNEQPLLLANSDQWIEWDSDEFFKDVDEKGSDAALLTFTAHHPRWSFAKVGEDGWVECVAEKKPISNIASTGIYWFKKGADFVRSAEQMMTKEERRIQNEWYVCPTLNELIENGGKVSTFSVKQMWGTGTPEDYDAFLASGIKI